MSGPTSKFADGQADDVSILLLWSTADQVQRSVMRQCEYLLTPADSTILRIRLCTFVPRFYVLRQTATVSNQRLSSFAIAVRSITIGKYDWCKLRFTRVPQTANGRLVVRVHDGFIGGERDHSIAASSRKSAAPGDTATHRC
jgi:hypothetical protein